MLFVLLMQISQEVIKLSPFDTLLFQMVPSDPTEDKTDKNTERLEAHVSQKYVVSVNDHH